MLLRLKHHLWKIEQEMYLFRSSPFLFLTMFGLTGVWWLGGWLLARSVFQLRIRERIMVGLGLGFLLHLVSANLFSHIMPFQWAYLLGSLAVLALGVALGYKKPFRKQAVAEYKTASRILPYFLILLAVFFLINRGLAIFDEGYNLPLVSRMAAGDVPPHFFFYPSYSMPYHYGLHLFAAALTRLGGLYPWSAFDLARAFTHALMLILAALWFWRVTQRSFGGIVGATVTYFAGGTQWLLLFAPPTWLTKLSDQITLINSAAVSGTDIYSVLSRPWAIEGGSAAPFPFAYISGIFLPQNLALTSYGACVALTIFLLLLVSPRCWTKANAFIVSFILASLALTAEHLFALIMLAVGLVWLIRTIRMRRFSNLGELILLGAPATLLAVVAGGVITVWVQRLWATWFGGSVVYGYGLTGLQLRLPPAVMSVHFGRLELYNLNHALVALTQMGPAVVFLFLSAGWLIKHWFRFDWIKAALFLSPWIGLLISLTFDYQERAREITRFMDVSLLLGVILSLPLLLNTFPRLSPTRQIILILTIIIMIWSGLATFSVQLLSIPRPQFTYFITPLDAQFTKIYWNTLPADAQVFDPDPSRAVVVFGRSVGKVSQDYRKPLPQWTDLVENFDLNRLIEQGYTYLYLDERYWNQMKSQEKSSLERSCVIRQDAQEGTGGTFRHLYSLENCR